MRGCSRITLFCVRTDSFEILMLQLTFSWVAGHDIVQLSNAIF